MAVVVGGVLYLCESVRIWFESKMCLVCDIFIGAD